MSPVSFRLALILQTQSAFPLDEYAELPYDDWDECWMPLVADPRITINGRRYSRRDFVTQQWTALPVSWKNWEYENTCINGALCFNPTHQQMQQVRKGRRTRFPHEHPEVRNREHLFRLCMSRQVPWTKVPVTIEEYLRQHATPEEVKNHKVRTKDNATRRWDLPSPRSRT